MKEKLSCFHAAILVHMTQTGIVIFALPGLLAVQFGTNGWLAVPLYFIVTLINVSLIAIVYRVGEGKSIFDILERSIPKVMLYPLYVFLIGLWSLIGCIAAKKYILLFQLIAFPTTNPMAFKFVIDLLAYALIVKGLYNIAKTATVFFWLIIWMGLFLFYFFGDLEWVTFTPFVFQGGHHDVKTYFDIYAAFLGYELSLLFIGYSDRKTRLVKAIIWGNGITAINYILICLVSFGFFSLPQLKSLFVPLLDLLASIKLPFIERIENLLYGFFLFSTILTIGMYSWSAKEVSQRIFPTVRSRFLAFVIVLLSFIVSFIPKSLYEVDKWLRLLAYLEFWVAFGLPLLLISVLIVQRGSKGELSHG
ncbi:spore germination protein (amino acid permease) [Cohnella lupini]|uniref:Spore germination protein (Amino acid permease) n=1 Tax=Cohnella lupini TaxID=1294267 RepID=A0A3D9HNU4_9BACL|nr:spore germination protein (amino acid permease) [Cohnella lupini]